MKNKNKNTAQIFVIAICLNTFLLAACSGGGGASSPSNNPGNGGSTPNPVVDISDVPASIDGAGGQLSVLETITGQNPVQSDCVNYTEDGLNKSMQQLAFTDYENGIAKVMILETRIWHTSFCVSYNVFTIQQRYYFYLVGTNPTVQDATSVNLIMDTTKVYPGVNGASIMNQEALCGYTNWDSNGKYITNKTEVECETAHLKFTPAPLFVRGEELYSILKYVPNSQSGDKFFVGAFMWNENQRPTQYLPYAFAKQY